MIDDPMGLTFMSCCTHQYTTPTANPSASSTNNDGNFISAPFPDFTEITEISSASDRMTQRITSPERAYARTPPRDPAVAMNSPVLMKRPMPIVPENAMPIHHGRGQSFRFSWVSLGDREKGRTRDMTPLQLLVEMLIPEQLVLLTSAWGDTARWGRGHPAVWHAVEARSRG